MATKAFISPVDSGWYDRPGDAWCGDYGSDYAAQDEARRIISRTEPFPLVERPLADLSGDVKYALRESLLRFCIFRCPS